MCVCVFGPQDECPAGAASGGDDEQLLSAGQRRRHSSAHLLHTLQRRRQRPAGGDETEVSVWKVGLPVSCSGQDRRLRMRRHLVAGEN